MRYASIGILIFFALALWARWDYLDKKGHWSKKEDLVLFTDFRIYLLDQIMQEIPSGMGYGPLSIAAEFNVDGRHAVDSLVHTLQERNDMMLLILGSHHKEESQVQVAQYANLGLARAHWLGDELVKKGISRSRLIHRDTLIEKGQPNFSHLHIVRQE